MKSRVNSFDTSVILRVLLNDIEEYRDLAVILLAYPNAVYRVELLAISEVIYVMERQYRRKRKYIVADLQRFLKIDNIIYERELVDEALELYLEHPKLSFNDCCLEVQAKLNVAVPLWTFDRKLANQLPGAKILEAADFV